MKIHRMLNKNYIFRSTLKKKKNATKATEDEKSKLEKHFTSTNKRIKRLKDKLYVEFSLQKGMRNLREDSIREKNIISIFESSLTRTLKMNTNTLSTDLFVIQVYFFEVLRDIALNGFMYEDEKYIIFTASAGQLRVKKVVCIKESILLKYQNTLMCGLSSDNINELGGVNINKLLAYKSLYSSSTDEWTSFDIDKSIVVEDMELPVSAEVDYIDNKTYEITRQVMDVPVAHTDGAGMILPSLSKKNFMFRMPWFKGILTPFDFREFITKESNGQSMVTDIWGKEWDLIKDDVQIIFTKSQFKMYKFYKDWDDYKNKFKKYNCQAGICNLEEDNIKDSRLNYQMIQSLSDITNEEINNMVEETVKEIRDIATDRNVMLRVLGVSKYNKVKYSFHEALEVYPELLNDEYTKTVLKDVKKSLVKHAKSAKLKIKGKYLFLIPDMFAFCEWLIKKEIVPTGLLADGEVFCKIYKDSEKIDVLRSPHLYREHAIRNNIIDEEKKKWFISAGVYTSIKDPISKLLQFDNDGDKALAVIDEQFIYIAERHMKKDNIVPLYYEMASAKPEKITNQGIYNGLISAYKGSNIGEYSNSITKIWNSNNIDLTVIKHLVLENNFRIDYAKTKIMPIRPKSVNNSIRTHTKVKVPNFFIYAKDKGKKEVERSNNSTVNRIGKAIPNPRLTFKKMGDFDYRMLMSGENKNVDLNKTIIDMYMDMDSKGYFSTNYEENNQGNSYQVYKNIKEKVMGTCNDVKYVTDVLVEYLYKYKKSAYKTTLWMCFGDTIVENLKNNILETFGEKTSNCETCNIRIIPTGRNHKMCDACWKEREKEIKRDWWNKNK